MARIIRLREQMVAVCRRLQENGLVAASDGNVSCRVGSDLLLVTPSGTVKGALRPKDLICVNLQGEVVRGRRKPSSELKMHLLIYRRRADVNAVVHAHPPLLTAMTLARRPLVAQALPEVVLSFGAVPTAPYATPSTAEVPAAIEPFIADHQAVLLERHGSLTMGQDLMQAYLRTEKLEQAARILICAHHLSAGPIAGLPPKALAALAEAFPGHLSLARSSDSC